METELQSSVQSCSELDGKWYNRCCINPCSEVYSFYLFDVLPCLWSRMYTIFAGVVLYGLCLFVFCFLIFKGVYFHFHLQVQICVKYMLCMICSSLVCVVLFAWAFCMWENRRGEVFVFSHSNNISYSCTLANEEGVGRGMWRGAGDELFKWGEIVLKKMLQWFFKKPKINM
jgi:hypothetical protein